ATRPNKPTGWRATPRRLDRGAELWSLRVAAKHGELLPERQVLEREVDAGCERRAQDAQQSECEVHCSPWLARRLPIVQSRGRVLAKDKAVLFCFALFAGSEAALARGGRAGGGGSEHGRPYRDVRRQPVDARAKERYREPPDAQSRLVRGFAQERCGGKVEVKDEDGKRGLLVKPQARSRN